MSVKEMREEIVDIVSSLCSENNLDYREAWLAIYDAYESSYNIPVTVLYKMGLHKSKFEFLEAYEELYSTFTKLYNLIKTTQQK